MREVYGNSNSRFYRFLEIRNDIDLLTKYLGYFPHHNELFRNFEYSFIHFSKWIHSLYLNNKVFKINHDIDIHFKKLIYNLHGIYLSNREPLTITAVVQHLVTLHPKLQNFLFNRYKYLNNELI